RRILDGLAERELLYEAAKKLDLGVSDDAIEQELTAGRAYVSLPADEADVLAYQLGLCRRPAMGYGCEPGAAHLRNPSTITFIRKRSAFSPIADPRSSARPRSESWSPSVCARSFEPASGFRKTRHLRSTSGI